MKRWELISVALIALVGSLSLAWGAETTEDSLDEGLVVPFHGYINASEPFQMSVSVGSNVTFASFFVDWMNLSSDLDMTLVSPSGRNIDSSVGEPIAFNESNASIYYMVPDPEPGEWVATVTAKEVPAVGEEYWAYSYLEEEESVVNAATNSSSNSSEEEFLSEECEECNKA